MAGARVKRGNALVRRFCSRLFGLWQAFVLEAAIFARIIAFTGKGERTEHGCRQNRGGDGSPMSWKDATTAALRPG